MLCWGLDFKKKSSEDDRPPVLRRKVSPKLKDLHPQSWSVGRGKGGKKLSLAASLVKSKSEIGLTKFYKIHKCAVGLVKRNVSEKNLKDKK